MEGYASAASAACIARTGYTGEPGVELIAAWADTEPLFDALLRRREHGVVPCGLGARDTLRLEVCYPLHGNDITPETNAIEAGLGWVCALDKDFIGADVLRRVKAEGPKRRLVALRMLDRAIPRAGHPLLDEGEHDRRGHERHAVAEPRPRYRPRLSSRGPRRARERRAGRRSRACAGRRGGAEAALQEGDLSMAAERELPGRPPLPPGARLGADRRGRGRLRDHLVRPGRARRDRRTTSRPRRRRRVEADAPYGELESVKAVSDVIAPLDRRGRRGQRGRRRVARARQPGSVRRGLADPRAPGRPGVRGRPDGRRRLPRAPADAVGRSRRALHAHTDQRSRARCSPRSASSSVDALFEDIPGLAALHRPARHPAAAVGARAPARARRAGRAATPRSRTSCSFLGAGMYDHHVPAVRGRGSRAAPSSRRPTRRTSPRSRRAR